MGPLAEYMLRAGGDIIKYAGKTFNYKAFYTIE